MIWEKRLPLRSRSERGSKSAAVLGFLVLDFAIVSVVEVSEAEGENLF